MSAFIEFLSGQVPGGFLLLLFLLVALHLALLFFKSSGLIDGKHMARLSLRISLLLIALYGAFWITLQPPQPPKRVIVLPTRTEENGFRLEGRSFQLAQLVQMQDGKQPKSEFIVHHWQWLLETIGGDSAGQYDLWKSIALKLQPRYIVESRWQRTGLQLVIYDLKEDNEATYEIAEISKPRTVLQPIHETLGLFKDLNEASQMPANKELKARLAYRLGHYKRVKQFVEGVTDPYAEILRAAVLMEKGLREKIDRERAAYTGYNNTYFNQAKNILHPIIQRREDTAELHYILGRIAIREGDYNRAELLLKRALVGDEHNARVFYALSLLLPERLKDFGFKSRVEVLQKAVDIDPGFTNAVYRLADELYNSGTGTPQGLGTQRALNVLEAYLKIRHRDPEILSLAGSIYLKTSQFKKARRVFENLNMRFPDDPNGYYNLGVVHFNLNQYERAVELFKKAIETGDHADSYLYLGYIYRQMGKPDSALSYFRERVKRKSGGDDRYAKEAMLGIRKILAEKSEASQ